MNMDNIIGYGIVWVGIFATLEMLWGILIVSIGLFAYRKKLDMSFIHIFVIYLALLNPFTAREVSTKVSDYLENL